jgi:hypothetical protein
VFEHRFAPPRSPTSHRCSLATDILIVPTITTTITTMRIDSVMRTYAGADVRARGIAGRRRMCACARVRVCACMRLPRDAFKNAEARLQNLCALHTYRRTGGGSERERERGGGGRLPCAYRAAPAQYLRTPASEQPMLLCSFLRHRVRALPRLYT